MLRFILANIWERKLRSLVTAFGLAVATGMLFSLLAFRRGYERGLRRELEDLGAHILVVPKGCPYDAASLALHGANWPCYLKDSYVSQVAQAPGVSVAAPVLMAADHREKHHIVMGVTAEYLRIRPRWNITGSFPLRADEVLLGAQEADRLKAALGDEFFMAPMRRNLRVSGILARTSSPDDEFAFVRLEDAQAAFNRRGQMTHVLVKLRSPEWLEKTVQSLRGCDAGMQMNIVPLAHLFETIRSVSASATYLLAGLGAIAFLVAGTALANTMLMAVLERRREIGVLRAVGASTMQVFILFLGETLLLGSIGSMAGIGGALAGSHLIEGWARTKIAYAPESSLIGMDFSAVIAACGFALVVSVLVAVLPALRAARLHPVEAFRAHAAY